MLNPPDPQTKATLNAAVAQVEGVGLPVTRESVCKNKLAILHTIRELGNRVSVPILETHIGSMYKLVAKTVDRALNDLYCNDSSFMICTIG